MKNWRNSIVLVLGLLLVIGSFIAYGVRVAQTHLPAGSTPEQIQQLTQQYGLDRPPIEQFGLFLGLFLPGITLLAVYGLIGIRRPDNPHGILPKFFMGLIMLVNVITALSFLFLASPIETPLSAFWLYLAVAILGLANFFFCLVVWNGYRWGVWCLGVSAFLTVTLKFVGSQPIVPLLFELSAVVILYVLIRPYWNEMD